MIRLLLAFLIFLPGQAVAQQVRVTSGEHVGFTRLVINFRAPTEWMVGSVESGYAFRALEFDRGYNLSKAFDLIPRHRVRDIVQTDTGDLQIRTDCDCHINAFELAAGQVVIDVMDGPAPEELASFQEPLDLRLKDLGLATDLGESDTPEVHIQLPVVLDPRAHHGLLPSFEPIETKVESAALASESGENLQRAAELAVTLSEEMARAAAMGFVEPALEEIEPYEDVLDHDVEFVAPESEQTPISVEPLPVEKTHIAIETSLERALADHMDPDDSILVNAGGEACLDGKLFNISEWGGKYGVETGIGAFRSGVLGEFDLTQSQGVEELVRYYLFMTFGAEAKAILSQFGADLDNVNVYITMADILDQRPVQNAEAFLSQLECNSPAALWALLAQSELHAEIDLNEAGIIRSFSQLPVHLRSYLGPLVVEKLLDFDRESAAESVEAVVRRIEDVTPEMQLMSARIARVSGDAAGAEELLGDLISVSSTALEDAVVERVDIALDAGEAIDQETIELLESLVFEHRDDSVAKPLQTRLISALIQNQELKRAAKWLSIMGERHPELFADFVDSLLFALATSGKAADLAWVVAKNAEWLTIAKPEIRAGIAKALLDGQLLEAARHVLASSTSTPLLEERLVLAELVILDGNAESAIGYLVGIETDAAKRLEARALLDMGKTDQAMVLLSELDAPEEVAAVAWENGVWNQAKLSPVSAIETASVAMAEIESQEKELADSEDLSLERTSDLLEESAASRDLIKNLLSSTAINPDVVNR